MTWIVPPVRGLIDPNCIQDIFVEGLGCIEQLGQECVRFSLYAIRNVGDGELEKAVVVRLVYPRSVAHTINRQCRAYLAGETAISSEAPIGIMPN